MKTKNASIAIIGAPNVGKSTLLNTILGTKVSIVSRKAQTTRTRITGIYTEDNTQLIFLDTPGLFSPNKRFEKAMVTSIWQSIYDTDSVLLLYDASKKRIDSKTIEIIKELKNHDKNIFLVFNKIDLIKKETLLSLAHEFDAFGIFSEIFMISALKDDGIQGLLKHLKSIAPEGPFTYPEDEVTNISTKLLAAEITREKIFEFLHDEIPYSCTVETETLEKHPKGGYQLSQVIYVERDTHKSMILGKQGRMIKKIGTLAREELEDILDQRIHLKTFVKVKKNWMNDSERYDALGLDF